MYKKSFGLIMAVFLFLIMAGLPTRAAATSYDVTDFGADGSDTQTDTLAIQNALNQAIGSNVVVTVTIPSGTYYIDRGLKIYSNTYLKLSSNATLYRTDEAAEYNIIHVSDQNGYRDQIGGYNKAHDITLDGGNYDGGNVANTQVPTDVVCLDHCKNVVVKNATFRHVYDCHLLELVGVKNATVTNCRFSEFVYNVNHKNEVKYGREAIQIESAWTDNPSNLNDKSSQWAGGCKVDATHCEDIVISNCTFTDYPCCVGQHHISSSPKYSNSKNITIKDNVIKADMKYTYFKTAITGGGMDNLTISGNTVVGAYQFGTNIYGGKNITVKSNTFSGTRANAINVTNGAVVKEISYNNIMSAGGHGISVLADACVGSNSVANTGILKNTITSSKKNGICVSDKAKIARINSNSILSAGGHGISVLADTCVGSNSVADSGILKNTITSSKKNGICVSDKAKIARINSNSILKNGQHGISIVGSITIGSSKVKNSGILYNNINDSKRNGISISGGSTSYVNSNKIYSSGNNGISFTKGKIYQITKNTIKKKGKFGIFIYKKSAVKKKVKAKSNKISGFKRKIYTRK